MNISNDWTNISDQEAKECISYLRKNICKYKIVKNDNVIDIDGVVNISHFIKMHTVTKNMSAGDYVVKINNKIFYKKNSPVYSDALDLFYKAEKEAKPFKVKVAEWQERNGEDIKRLALLIVCLSMFAGGIYSIYRLETAQQERQKQEIIKQVYEMIKQEQQKQESIIKYHDAQKIKH